MSDYYTGKELLLGLRQELKKLDKELRELDKMIVCYGDERYKGSCFSNYISVKKDEMIYCLNTNYTLREKLYSLLFEQNRLFYYTMVRYNTILDQNGNYILMAGNKNLIANDKQEAFNERVKSILHNPFVKDINNLEYNNESLEINSKRLSYFTCDERIGKNALSFGYYVNDDVIYLRVTGKNRVRTLDSIVYEVLSIKVPKDKFTPFLRQVIEESSETKKQIYVPKEILLLGKEKCYLSEEEQGYSLIKRK